MRQKAVLSQADYRIWVAQSRQKWQKISKSETIQIMSSEIVALLSQMDTERSNRAEYITNVSYEK
jgi:hypothetical protein